jgi:cytochrome c-type biogenesis protein CcmH/NrfG
VAQAHFGATSYVESESAYRQAVSADGKRVTAWQGLSELYNEQADKAAVDKIIDKVALPKLINVLKVRR